MFHFSFYEPSRIEYIQYNTLHKSIAQTEISNSREVNLTKTIEDDWT